MNHEIQTDVTKVLTVLSKQNFQQYFQATYRGKKDLLGCKIV
jgi:hypothetical protein